MANRVTARGTPVEAEPRRRELREALVFLFLIVAPIVMHFLQDFGAIVLLPLLGYR